MARKIETKIAEVPVEPLKVSLKALCEERDIKKEKLVEYLKDILKNVAREIKGPGNYEVEYDEKNESFTLMRKKVVVSEVKDPNTEIHIDEARKFDPSAEVGDEAYEIIPFESLGRRGAYRAKVMLERIISEGIEESIFDEYSKRIGNLITGIVKKIETDRITRKKRVYVDIGRNITGVIPPEEMLPQDHTRLKEGDSIKAIIKDVRKIEKGRTLRTEIILSRADKKFVEEIVKKNVVEVEQGIIKIKSIARIPGVRTKIMVYSDDPNIDAVGTCVGVKGIRIKNIIQELGGERVDIIQWDSDIQRLVVNTLGINKFNAMFQITDTKTGQKEIIVIVPDDILALAVGRGGINVKLASELIGMRIRVRSESERERIKQMLPDFFQKLGITEKQAQLMWEAGIKTIEDIVIIPQEKLLTIPGLTEAEARRIWTEARRIYFEKLREEKRKEEAPAEETTN